MNTIKVLKVFVYLEIASLIFLFFFILFERTVSFITKKINQKKKQRLSQVVANCYENKQECHLIPKIYKKQLLLEVIEEYNHRFIGEDWELLKKGLVVKLLLPKARSRVKSFFWNKRNFSARVFALVPTYEDEDKILKLIDDPVFLVSSIAATAAIKLESEKGVLKILSLMHLKEGYSHYFFADILSQGSNKIFQMISNVIKRKDENQLACLEVLALQTGQVPLNFLQEILQSKEEKIKIAALKVAIRNMQQEYQELFCQFIEDKNDMIRALSASGLGKFKDQKSCNALKMAVSDPSWCVRLAAAKSLKELDMIDLIKDRELKQYVINFE